MTMAAEKDYAHIGQTRGCKDHDHDLVHELSDRLDALWRYDQFIANAEGKPSLKDFWSRLKQQEEKNVQELKQLISEEVKGGCF